MKKKLRKGILVLIILIIFSNYSAAQIANMYPGDLNIQSDPNVIFTEMFEESTIAEMLTFWTNKSYVPANISFGSSVPAGSYGNKSCVMRTIVGNDSTENTYLYKRFTPGFNDSIFVRYYVKYNTTSTFHHSGVWIGGHNPPRNSPGIRAGYKPAGDSTFHVGSEVRGAVMTPQNFASFGFYNYWMGMHQSNQINPLTGTGYYWGNGFISPNPISQIDMSQWHCIEVMIRLNNPVTGNTGELALWINGVRIAYYGYQFPNGTWNWSNFIEGTGAPFEGFQWRNNSALNITYLWVKSYATNDAIGHISDMSYDHIVVAKKYIGPIYTKPLNIIENTNNSFVSVVVSNNSLKITTANEILRSAKIYDITGKLIGEFFTNNITISSFPKGIYFISIQTNNETITKKILRL